MEFVIITPHLKRFTYFEHFKLGQKFKIPQQAHIIELFTYESTEWLEELSKYKLIRVLELCILFGAPYDIVTKVKEELYKKSGKTTVVVNNWKFMKSQELNISPFSWI